MYNNILLGKSKLKNIYIYILFDISEFSVVIVFVKVVFAVNVIVVTVAVRTVVFSSYTQSSIPSPFQIILLTLFSVILF